MRYDDMKVETPVSLLDLEDFEFHDGHPGVYQCSWCGVGANRPWHPVEEMVTVRHWNVDSVDEPGGGHWTWYCTEHLERRAGNWWRSSHLAPPHLLPEEVHYCSRMSGLYKCGEVAIEPFDGEWLCGPHAGVERTNRRFAEILADDVEDQLER